MAVVDTLSDPAGSVVAVIVMSVLAIISFYVTVFVVRTGVAFAGSSPSGDFVSLSAAIRMAGATSLQTVAGTAE